LVGCQNFGKPFFRDCLVYYQNIGKFAQTLTCPSFGREPREIYLFAIKKVGSDMHATEKFIRTLIQARLHDVEIVKVGSYRLVKVDLCLGILGGKTK
jgi:hypothetical protein